MKHRKIINELSKNRTIFNDLLKDVPEKEYLWKWNPDKWCLLEIVCHLFDEEREDFRTRTKLVLQDPTIPLPPFDPTVWPLDRAYFQQNYNDKVYCFLNERDQSIDWLQTLKDPKWDNAFQHPKFGAMSAGLFLANWLAHDYLHLRQILTLKYKYLEQLSGESLSYAGGW